MAESFPFMPPAPSPSALLSTPLHSFLLPPPSSDSLPSLYLSQMVNQGKVVVSTVSWEGEHQKPWHLLPVGNTALSWQVRVRRQRKENADRFGPLTASHWTGAILTVHQVGKLSSSSRDGVRQEVLTISKLLSFVFCFVLAFFFLWESIKANNKHCQHFPLPLSSLGPALLRLAPALKLMWHMG